ncbi:hypothetical protein CCACVL1_18245, partial [Corchorus capsularis]
MDYCKCEQLFMRMSIISSFYQLNCHAFPDIDTWTCHVHHVSCK